MDLVKDYILAFRSHLKPAGYLAVAALALTGASYIPTVAQLMGQRVPAVWVARVAPWVIAIMAAQVSVWYEQWKKTAGTPENPYAGKGIKVTWCIDRDKFYEEEGNDDGSWSYSLSDPYSHTRIKAARDLRGRALQVTYSVDFSITDVRAQLSHGRSRGEENLHELIDAVRHSAARSILLDLRDYTRYRQWPITEVKIRIDMAEPLPAVVRVQDISPERRPGWLWRWVKRESAATGAVSRPASR